MISRVMSLDGFTKGVGICIHMNLRLNQEGTLGYPGVGVPFGIILSR